LSELAIEIHINQHFLMFYAAVTAKLGKWVASQRYLAYTSCGRKEDVAGLAC
jgi:hypothetical protein